MANQGGFGQTYFGQAPFGGSNTQPVPRDPDNVMFTAPTRTNHLTAPARINNFTASFRP